MERPKGRPKINDPEWRAYNKFLNTPKQRLKKKRADELIKKLIEVFGGHVVN